MKTKIVLMLAVLFCASGVYAQSDSAYEIKSLFGGKKGKNKITGFGAFMLQGHELPEKNDAVWTGFRGGIIINHNFAISVGGVGLASTNRFNKPAGDTGQYYMEGGYGGIYFEPIIASRFPVHLSFPCMIGAGGLAYTRSVKVNDPDVYFDRYENTVTVDDDAFVVFEPGISLELNLTRHSRIGFNAHYRFTQDLRLVNTDNDILEGWNGGITLKFGRF